MIPDEAQKGIDIPRVFNIVVNVYNTKEAILCLAQY